MEHPPPTEVYILCGDDAALQHITKIRSLDVDGQDHVLHLVLQFHHALTRFCLTHRDVGVMLAWSPVKRDRVQDSTARSAALKACTHSSQATTIPVRSLTFQKKQARRRVTILWPLKWHANGQSKIGRDHLAYDMAIL
jgi:hypothetical protein